MDIKEALTFDGLKYFYTKYIKPLKTGAFSTVVNNATTTVANTVLDGRMGKTLADKDANLQSQINTLNSSLADIFFAIRYSSDNKYVLAEWSPGIYWLRHEINTDGNPFPNDDGWLIDYKYVKIVISGKTGEVKYNYQLSNIWQGWRTINSMLSNSQLINNQ